MAKILKTKLITTVKKPESGLTGGPSTIRGVTYQLDHAVRLLLDIISLSLVNPFTTRSIAIEPRTSTPKVIRWDILTAPPETTYEAKFNPKREELIDWLKVVKESSAGTPARKFCFVYAEERAAAKLIQTVRALRRIAIEVGGVKEEFDKYVAYEEVKGADEVLNLLGDNATEFLLKIEIEQLSDSALDSDIQLRLRYLTTPERAKGLRDHLFEKLQRAAPSRVTFHIKSLIEELRVNGFTLNQPPVLDAQALQPQVFAALSVLQDCKGGFPISVLAVAIGIQPEILANELAALGEISSNNGLLYLVPLGARLAHSDESGLRAKALEELFAYIKKHGKSPLAQDQVPNAIALARSCLDTHPRLVAKAFGALDKLLKEVGKKHLVREVAMLSITAARPSMRTGDRDMKLAVIRSHICGLVWYYQRIGDFDEANVAARKSYGYATELDSKADLAYSAKCTGRLRRIEAESMETNERQSKLSESLGLLDTAIQKFTTAEGHGPDGAEVGDCYSLMARTHLVAGDLALARNKLGHAFARIPDDGGKDRLDALILDGDIEAASGNSDEALLRYDQAVAKAQLPSRQVTEMRARAFRQRGRIKRKMGNISDAEKDFKEAARIWTELEEPNLAAEAEFEMMDLSVVLSEHPLSMLIKEPAVVRVQAMKIHIASLAEYNQKNTRVAGRRSQPPDGYWKGLIKRAHDSVGFEGI